MGQFSPRATQAIQEFVRNMQMSAVTEALDGSYSFAFDHAGLLSLTASDDGKRAIISLKKATDRQLRADDLKAHLKLAHYDPITRKPVSAGLAKDGGLILAMSIGEDEFDLQAIELCFDRLIELQKAA